VLFEFVWNRLLRLPSFLLLLLSAQPKTPIPTLAAL